jgi:hypothetical protein
MTHHPPPHERTYDMSDETPERWLHHSEWSVQQHLAWAREGRRADAAVSVRESGREGNMRAFVAREPDLLIAALREVVGR